MAERSAKKSFSRLEQKDAIRRRMTAKQLEASPVEVLPHAVRLKKGSVPVHEDVTAIHRLGQTLLGGAIASYMQGRDFSNLERTLNSAHMRLRVDEHIAFVWFLTIVSAVGAGVGAAVLIGLSTAPGLDFFGQIGPMLLAVPLLVYLITMRLPTSRSKGRGKNIDRRLAYAMSFMSTLSAANVNVDVIFTELAKQPIYGEIQAEAQWIVRDIELLGKDVLTAIRDASARSPSQKLQDVLQGVVTTTLSGGQLKPYFILKADQLAKGMKLEQRKTLETLGLLAESFVTVVVAAPLFLIVMMSLLTIGATSRASVDSTILFLFIIVFVMIPISQFGFIVVLQSIAEEV